MWTYIAQRLLLIFRVLIGVEFREHFRINAEVYEVETMDQKDLEILKKFRRLLSEKVQVNQVILFGSRARGDAEPDSDMDVLVIIENKTDEIEDFVSDCAWEAGFYHGIVVSPVVYSRDEWENGPEHFSPFVQNVLAEGVHL